MNDQEQIKIVIMEVDPEADQSDEAIAGYLRHMASLIEDGYIEGQDGSGAFTWRIETK